MRPEMKEEYGPEGLHRERYSSRKIRFLLLILLLGIACLIWLRMGGPSVPCMFHKVTGLQCPGCGVTPSPCLTLSRSFYTALINGSGMKRQEQRLRLRQSFTARGLSYSGSSETLCEQFFSVSCPLFLRLRTAVNTAG